MSYLSRYLSGEKLNKRVELIEELFPYESLDFDTLAVRGNSGVLLGSILGYKWNKDIIIVRKIEEACHGNTVEGWGKDQKILIVDDFVESGETIDIIFEKIHIHCDNPSVAGLLLYSGGNRESFETDYMLESGVRLRCWKVKQ